MLKNQGAYSAEIQESGDAGWYREEVLLSSDTVGLLLRSGDVVDSCTTHGDMSSIIGIPLELLGSPTGDALSEAVAVIPSHMLEASNSCSPVSDSRRLPNFFLNTFLWYWKTLLSACAEELLQGTALWRV